MSDVHVTVLWPSQQGGGTVQQTFTASAVPDVGERFNVYYEDPFVVGVLVFHGRVAQRHWTYRLPPLLADEGSELSVSLILKEAYDVDS